MTSQSSFCQVTNTVLFIVPSFENSIHSEGQNRLNRINADCWCMIRFVQILLAAWTDVEVYTISHCPDKKPQRSTHRYPTSLFDLPATSHPCVILFLFGLRDLFRLCHTHRALLTYQDVLPLRIRYRRVLRLLLQT